MAPKSKSSGEAQQEAELAEMRRKHLCFRPSLLISRELVEKYRALVAGRGNENGPTILQHTEAPEEEGQVRFFSAFLSSRLVPPFSDFFSKIMTEFDLKLLNLHPNVVSMLSILAHLCENFVGVLPSVALFSYFYSPKVDNKNKSGSFTWRLRNGMSREYVGGHLITHWVEWRQD